MFGNSHIGSSSCTAMVQKSPTPPQTSMELEEEPFREDSSL